jgi:hypothetical protein
MSGALAGVLDGWTPKSVTVICTGIILGSMVLLSTKDDD